MYGQQEVVKDLIRARETAGGQVYFDIDDAMPVDLDTEAPRVILTMERQPAEIAADFVAGCDGFHGVCRRAVPAGTFTTYEHAYPFAWLGILAAVAPSAEELIYAVHERGFALHSMRTPAISRLYLQVGPEEPLANWPDERIWSELRTRFALDGGRVLNEGPILSRGVTAMRSFVIEPMQYHRLFLAGDAAHIVPPTGAKGLNLAARDVDQLATALIAHYREGREDLLNGYSESALRRIWRAERFSVWMTSVLHAFPQRTSFDRGLQIAELEYLVGSEAASAAFVTRCPSIQVPFALFSSTTT